MGPNENFLKLAHKASAHNEATIKDSLLTICFHCCTYFDPSKISKWTDEKSEDGRTAICPVCGIDAVLGNRCGFPIEDPAFIKAMHKYWFSKKQ